jgi:hypothetical protein
VTQDHRSPTRKAHRGLAPTSALPRPRVTPNKRRKADTAAFTVIDESPAIANYCRSGLIP